MNGRALYTNAVRRMTESARCVLKQVSWSSADLEVFIGHQANQRILDSVAERLGVGPTRQHGNIREVGNTAAASIPIALADAAARGAAGRGARTLITAFGAGYTWGSAALTFPAAKPYTRPPHSLDDPYPLAADDRDYAVSDQPA